ncbi:caspase family protein [Aquabacterium sp. OR-4]|uniref:caspase family protein n=1 Tax=Aquabacterium sp. OR-4 TaxID=2978127 RepID=UPI0028C693A3|nr:caspase family protein [Aquabacterium sp. OR-4]MDT7834344.1 caspase family protein [Aquabacterium sp. OR-4]
MAKKAICVGINKFANYPQFALNGCVNDAKDMAALAKEVLGFKAGEIKTLVDAQATKAAIMAELQAAVAAAKAGKLSYLLFSLSSHGTQMADKSGDEPDGMDEAFVPYDIAQKGNAWDPARIISDDELNGLFAQLPASTLLEVYLDTCHSGSGLRGAEFSLHAPRARYVAPPAGELQGAVRQRTVRGFTLQRAPGSSAAAGKGKKAAQATAAAAADKAVAGRNHVLWSGCKANQTSADAYFSGRYNGAFTYWYVKTLRDSGNKLSRKAVVTKVRAALKGQFSQVPQLEGNATNRASAIVY